MKKMLMALISLLILLVAAGIYRFNFTNDDVYIVQSDGSVLKHDKGVNYRSPVMLKLFSVDTAKDWIIKVPEINKSVALTGFVNLSGIEYVAGGYINGAEKGVVFLDYMKIQPVNMGGAEKGMWFLAPFVIDGQGSGNFWYLGLFYFDNKSHGIAHQASYFVGDRIRIRSLEIDESFDITGSVVVTFFDYGEGQSFGELPAEERMKKLEVNEEGIFDKANRE